jgi:uncharacterized protein (DUF1697 family)
MRYTAFLRGINVGSSNRIKMPELKNVLEQTGLSDVRTYIQSGNIAFESGISGSDELSAMIKDALSKHFGIEAECFVKTAEQLEKIIAGNPYSREDTDHISVVLFNQPADPNTLHWESGDDEALRASDAVYLLCRTSLHTTKLNNSFFEKALGQPCTSRNWRTVNEMMNL